MDVLKMFEEASAKVKETHGGSDENVRLGAALTLTELQIRVALSAKEPVKKTK